MRLKGRFREKPTRIAIEIGASVLIALGAAKLLAIPKDSSGFPAGYDALQAAPKSHKVIFENELVRVLEVTVPPAGESEPMHHHRWPSFFLEWDTGGKSPHVRYHRPDGSIQDSPSEASPTHPGRWSVHWMKPEPMHSIETVEKFDAPGAPPLLRVEIKISP
jgi:hypothetical protein